MTTQTTPAPVAVVTGASRGLGLALAKALAAAGWQLIIDARKTADLSAATADLSAYAAPAPIAIPGSIADPAHRQALADAAARAGGVDILVNNAGILGPSPLPGLVNYPLDDLVDVFRVNVAAQLGVIQALFPHLRPGARVVSISSDAAVEAYPGWGGYGATKAALEQLTAVFAAENPSLRVYTVDPGDMRTRMHQEAFPGEDISDRPLPEASVPGLLLLLQGDLPNGRYAARQLAPATAVGG